jgi:hypothetical protein
MAFYWNLSFCKSHFYWQFELSQKVTWYYMLAFWLTSKIALDSCRHDPNNCERTLNEKNKTSSQEKIERRKLNVSWIFTKLLMGCYYIMSFRHNMGLQCWMDDALVVVSLSLPATSKPCFNIRYACILTSVSLIWWVPLEIWQTLYRSRKLIIRATFMDVWV